MIYFSLLKNKKSAQLEFYAISRLFLHVNFYFLNTSETVIPDGLNQKQTINLKSGIRLQLFRICL